MIALTLAVAPPAAPRAADVPADVPADLLAGPSARASADAAKARRPTLVVRGFDGEILRAGPEPGLDALRAMQETGGEWALDGSEARAVDTVADARAAALDALIRMNAARLLSLQGLAARATSPNLGERIGAVLELGLALDSFKPYFDRGGFLDEFARADGVRPDTIARAREIEQRYITALVRSAQSRRVEAGARPEGEFAIRLRLRLEHLGTLLRQAIERKVALAESEFDGFANALSLDGGLREKVKAELSPLFIAELAGKSTPAMRLDAVRRVYAMLGPDQRRALLVYLADRRGGAPRAETGVGSGHAGTQAPSGVSRP